MKISAQKCTINNYNINSKKAYTNFPVNKKDSISFTKSQNNKNYNKNAKKIGASLASFALASSLFLGGCTSSEKNYDIYDETYLTGENRTEGGILSKSHIKGNLNKTTYDIEESRIYDLDILHPKRNYSGRFGDDEINYTIQVENLFKEGRISGYIADEPFDLQIVLVGLGKNVITGTYKGQDVCLAVHRNVFGSDTIISNHSDLVLDYDFASNKNFSIEGNFEYDNDLLPVIFSYMKFKYDVEVESNK